MDEALRDPRGGASGLGVWLRGARPRTLVASICPVLVGTAVAASGGRLVPWRALAVLVVSVAIQVGVNYANDYSDGVRGTDTPARVGPVRLLASASWRCWCSSAWWRPPGRPTSRRSGWRAWRWRPRSRSGSARWRSCSPTTSATWTAVAPVRLVRHRQDGPGLVAALAGTARLQLAVCALLAIGLWLS